MAITVVFNGGSPGTCLDGVWHMAGAQKIVFVLITTGIVITMLNQLGKE